MKLKNKTRWDQFVEANKDDGYGNAIVRYAEAAADKIEDEMAVGTKLEDCAHRCLRAADTEGIKGFMYGAAIEMLAECWEFGEPLRLWHNVRTQMHDEGDRANRDGGVLNPALLTVRDS